MVGNRAPDKGPSRRHQLTLGLLVVVAAAFAVVIASVTSHAKADPGTAATPSSAVLSHYAVFRRATNASDGLPSQRLTEIVSENELTRRQPTPYPGYSQWATLEGEHLCVVDRFTSASSPTSEPATNRSCNEAQYLEKHQQLLVQASYAGGTSSTPPQLGLANLISGLAPNGVNNVTLVFADGAERIVPVVANGFTYSLESAKKLVNVIWTDESGETLAEDQ